MHKFGIVIRNNMYYGPSKEGELERWSNFIMIPHFHIKNKTSVRKFTLINEYGQQEVLAIPQGKFTSVQNFTTEIEKLGNFVWLAKQDKFNKIKEFIRNDRLSQQYFNPGLAGERESICFRRRAA